MAYEMTSLIKKMLLYHWGKEPETGKFSTKPWILDHELVTNLSFKELFDEFLNPLLSFNKHKPGNAFTRHHQIFFCDDKSNFVFLITVDKTSSIW